MTAAAAGLVDCWNRIAHTASPRLSSLQLRALNAIHRSPGINLTRLAEEVGAGAPAASRLCDRLEAAGLLRRRRSPDNRREVGLVLTHHGHEALDVLYERRSEALREVLRRMPAAQRRCLLDGLRAFTEATDTTPDAPH
ncbi:MarR family winged helix-turn-helix transcriptional regulator [Streptomyces sp. CB00455]|uniref:MarR family winged helix-turn-helix transcriptional regulator n=1 Tax=Streptomyces sp. CB00455 TaxID=1703927 RepID=UPI001F5B6FEC|nr:MarR family transcriptional regulator [Streptomyces sp. CB00455]